MLSVIDKFTRECLSLEVDTSFASPRVTRALDGSHPVAWAAAKHTLRQCAKCKWKFLALSIVLLCIALGATLLPENDQKTEIRVVFHDDWEPR